MSDHGVAFSDLPADGEKVEVSKFSKILTVSAGVGGIGILVSLGIFLFGGGDGGGDGVTLSESYSYSWLFACYFFFTLALGGLFWVLLHHASNSGWGVAVRRVMEHLANMLPFAFLMFTPIIFLRTPRESLYEWMHMLRIGEADALLLDKAPYLTMGFFFVRIIFYAIALSGIAYILRRWSLRQDATGDVRPTFLARRWSCGFIPIFALSATFMAFYLLMGLDYTWFSTMWGVYIFAGSALSSMAVIILSVTALRHHGYLGQVVSKEHYHIMGKLMFTFTVFWAYISFSQFFLYWYAKIPEETKFYILRNTEGWYYLSIFLVFAHFAVPFVFLLRQGAKKDMRQICAAAVWVLLVHMLDIYWIVIPERGPSLTAGESLTISGTLFLDVIAFVSIGASLLYVYLRTIGRYSIYPPRDPRLHESVRLVN